MYVLYVHGPQCDPHFPVLPFGNEFFWEMFYHKVSSMNPLVVADDLPDEMMTRWTCKGRGGDVEV